MPVSDHVVTAVRALAVAGRIGSLTVDDLRAEDVDCLDWSGGHLHMAAVREALARVASGQVEYLAVRSPTGEPVAKGGIDYTKHDDAGLLWQLATHPQLQSLGLGSMLLTEAMDRIRQRGCRWAVIGVEASNPRARVLYERLGFQVFSNDHASWRQEDGRGQTVTYQTEVTLLRRRP